MHHAGSAASQSSASVSSRPTSHPTPAQIADRIVDAILAARLAPGDHRGEQAQPDDHGVSRTLIREALARLAARGFVEVSSRRGWYVVQPSRAEATEAFEARAAVETGMLQTLAAPPSRAQLARLKAHQREERASIRAGDAGRRSFLLGDFHVCLAECVSGPLMADILRDLTARTTLVAALYQSTHDAARSCEEHADIVAALEAGDLAGAAALMHAHIAGVAADLGDAAPPADPPAHSRRSGAARRTA